MPDDFKTVGRFRLVEFLYEGKEAKAVIAYDQVPEQAVKNGLPHTAFHREDCYGNIDPYASGQLALLIDLLPPGKEKDYLDTVHRALWAMVDVECSVTNIFDAVSRDLSGIDVSGPFKSARKGYDKAMKRLKPLREKKPYNLPEPDLS